MVFWCGWEYESRWHAHDESGHWKKGPARYDDLEAVLEGSILTWAQVRKPCSAAVDQICEAQWSSSLITGTLQLRGLGGRAVMLQSFTRGAFAPSSIPRAEGQ